MAEETKPNETLDTPETTENAETPENPETGDAEAAAAVEALADADEQAKLDQEVKIEDVGPARKKITVTIPDERINQKIDGNLNDLQNEAVLPGFRRGRAPMRLIEKRFGSDVRGEAKTQLMAESYQQVIEENDLRVIGDPDIKGVDELELPEDGPFTFEVEVEVVPEFELPDLKGLKVEKKKVEVTDEQVDAEIDRYCEMRGKMASTDQPAEPGDYLSADVEVKLDDGEVAESRQGANIRVPDPQGPTKGRGQVAGILIEDLAGHVVGKKVGETVTIETTGPKQHENESLRGAKLTLEISINTVQRMEKAPVEDIAQAFGFDNEAEFKEQVKQSLQQRAEQQQQTEMRDQVTDAIIEKVEFDLPEGLSGRQTERILQRRAMEMTYQGASQQDIDEAMAEIRAASEEEAQKELKLFFILNKYAEQFDVDVSEGEVNGQIAQIAVQQGRRPEKMRQEMARSGRLEQLFIQLREQKVIDQILADAEIVEVEPEEAEEG